MRILFPLVIALLPLVLAGCEGGPLGTGSDPVRSATFAPELGIDLALMTRTSDGVYYRDLEVGSGPVVQPGTRVHVRYSGWLTDGWRFDQGEFAFVLGGSGVIPGFNRGVAGMRVGSRRQIVIPPALAYGSRPPPGSGIPPNAVLVFVVEVIGVS
jgi:FKBP-type peptidyl-prolyl cis-trans isomerase